MCSHAVNDASLTFETTKFLDGDYQQYPDEFCTLSGGNLFPIEYFPIFRRKTPAMIRAYTAITPALYLLSKIIREKSQTWAIFVQRKILGSQDVFLDDTAVCPVSNEEVISAITSNIPDFEFTDRMHLDTIGETNLRPGLPRDLVVLDYNLIQVLTSSGTSSSRKIAALVLIAVTIGHEIAHILEFRCLRGGLLNSDGTPFESPPGITGDEVGIAWEHRAFGASVHPVCEKEEEISLLVGLCLRSFSWNYKYMVADPQWLLKLFREDHWENSDHPLRPPVKSLKLCRMDSMIINSK